MFVLQLHLQFSSRNVRYSIFCCLVWWQRELVLCTPLPWRLCIIDAALYWVFFSVLFFFCHLVEWYSYCVNSCRTTSALWLPAEACYVVVCSLICWKLKGGSGCRLLHVVHFKHLSLIHGWVRSYAWSLYSKSYGAVAGGIFSDGGGAGVVCSETEMVFSLGLFSHIQQESFLTPVVPLMPQTISFHFTWILKENENLKEYNPLYFAVPTID